MKVSDCCNAGFFVTGDDKEGTNYYKCQKCRGACSVHESPSEESGLREILKEFDQKVCDVNSDGLFNSGNETKIHEFGYKILNGNCIYTITDWGNIRKHFENALSQISKTMVSREAVEKAIDEWHDNAEGLVLNKEDLKSKLRELK